MQKVFTEFDFTVQVENDVTHDKLVRLMKEMSMLDHQRYNCFVCCILSHGIIGAVYGADGKTVPITDLLLHFKPSSCPSLTGKPKIFIVQACQGTDNQRGYPRMCCCFFVLFMLH